jgi:hypothetical protein
MRCDAMQAKKRSDQGRKKKDRRPDRPNADLTTPDTTQTHTHTHTTHPLLCTSSPSAGEETGLARCRRRKNTPLPFFTFCSYLLKLYHYLIFLFPQSKLAHTPFSFFSHCCLKTLFFFFSSVLWRGVLGALTEEMRASSLLRFVYGRERLSGGFRPLSFSFSLADLGGLLIALCFCWFKAEKKKERLPFFFPLLLTAEGGKEKEQMSSHHLAARRRTPFHFFS